MGCFDPKPEDNKKLTSEQIARFIEKAKAAGLMMESGRKVEKPSTLLVDYMSLMK